MCAPLTACVPTLPTLPLVFLTLVLPSVLRLLGEDRFPMLRLPMPLPLFTMEVPGVLGRMGLLAIRSVIVRSSSSIRAGRLATSLPSVGTSHFVVVVVVVVQETARRLPLRLMGDCEALREAERRTARSHSLSLASTAMVDRCMVTISLSGLMSKGWFSVMTRRAPP